MSLPLYSAALCRGLIEATDLVENVKQFQWGIPRLYAAASLKLAVAGRGGEFPGSYSAALCRGLIEADCHGGSRRRGGGYSAALCRGLIEASARGRRAAHRPRRIPRLYAAASLKPRRNRTRSNAHRIGIPRLYAAASLKPPILYTNCRVQPSYSAALCRGLIEAICIHAASSSIPSGIPRLYAAASLKRWKRRRCGRPAMYSAALCRGLIEARCRERRMRPRRTGIPRLYAAASLKRLDAVDVLPAHVAVYSAALCRGLIEAHTVHRCSLHRRGRIPRLYAAASLKPSR